jgi:hypothetical protein
VAAIAARAGLDAVPLNAPATPVADSDALEAAAVVIVADVTLLYVSATSS